MVINWFQMKAENIATWTPSPALEGWFQGTYGDPLEHALCGRALEIQESWRQALWSKPTA